MSIKLGNTSINKVYLGGSEANKLYLGSTLVYDNAGAGGDADADAFIAAAGIVDGTQQAAIQTLVLSLKEDGIWVKMNAIYPMVGGTATSHKWNLKDPRDLDAAYRLVFNGGWTHSTTGAKPDGSTAYANTFLTPNTILNLNSTHISYYSKTDLNALQIEIGTQDSAAARNNLFLEIRTSTATYGAVNLSASDGFIDENSLGYYIASRTASNETVIYKNGVVKKTSSKLSTGLSTYPLFIGALNSEGVDKFYSGKENLFSSIGEGLTNTESLNLYNSVQAFQTSLGRQV